MISNILSLETYSGTITTDPVQMGPDFNNVEFYINHEDWTTQELIIHLQHNDGEGWKDDVRYVASNPGDKNCLYGSYGWHVEYDEKRENPILNIPPACQARLVIELPSELTFSVTEGGF